MVQVRTGRVPDVLSLIPFFQRVDTETKTSLQSGNHRRYSAGSHHSHRCARRCYFWNHHNVYTRLFDDGLSEENSDQFSF